jgi:methylenetetrahydrofolate dehydrogenase (NADP+)/methenyltetrahydrofolate cyclohydrolase
LVRQELRELDSIGANSPILLDGARLARARNDDLARRAAAVRARRGIPPRLALIAFADQHGQAPFAARKLRAGADAGVDIAPLVLPAGITTIAAADAMAKHLEAGGFDGVFVEFPFPDGVDGEALTVLIPEEADVDVMTAARIERYLAGGDDLPPVTISAALGLLDGYGVEVDGVRGVVVADPGPFALTFRAALARRGVALPPVVDPAAPDLESWLDDAELVVVAAGRPGLVSTGHLAPGAVAIDVGYFNPGGRGDIDTAAGTTHLAAIATVPGGIGPMTISALIERLIVFAERDSADD